jgi:2',3'-cyclic-nucleotide 2'-phosphodiesterase (5'-nucleotidase family)
MYNVFPFENYIATMFLSGDEVKELLDFVARKSSTRGCRTQAQVSGIWFDMVCSDPMAEPHAENIFIGDRCAGCRPPGGPGFDPTLPCQCQPLNPYGSYKVAVNDYIATGGSGFIVLQRNTTKFNTGISLRDALIDYIDAAVPKCGPGPYETRACLTSAVEAHDSRVNPVFK